MHSTVVHIRVKAGQPEALITMMEQWEQEQEANVKGALGDYIFRLDKDPQEMIMVAMFQDRESYIANVEDPEQDKWYQNFRQHLEASPEWNDGAAFGTVG